MSPQHVAALIDQAEQRGWVLREGDRTRGQRAPLSVTDTARNLLTDVWPLAQQIASPRSLGFSAAEFDHFIGLLQRALVPGVIDPHDVVVLLDADHHPCGTAPRADVHTADTPLHAAFSTYLFDEDDNLLMTRRALSKAAWPGVWTNSACGHLLPQETPFMAARRRVPYEIGAPPLALRMTLPEFRYQARDASGIVENEVCPVMVGTVDRDQINPNPTEVAEHTWIRWSTLTSMVDTAPALISPWCVLQVNQLRKLQEWKNRP
ncbi:Receptor activity-modifying protein 1 [Platysternon megacephalum]|uniref:isopentenyl-diphosphate Delta-isomerase n=1 Tax=Platysternon megacephalum TaxID=55544 RepID=A0A4D9DJW0_9SAUR|nr:Receptor activity-modifying protein 1 [Platysternon megacephalum]